MIFRKRKKPGRPQGHDSEGDGPDSDNAKMYRIDFEMMRKGSVLKRNGAPIKQHGITIDGSTRLVTSGDIVDRKTYEMLLESGAIMRPADRNKPGKNSSSTAGDPKTSDASG